VPHKREKKTEIEIDRTREREREKTTTKTSKHTVFRKKRRGFDEEPLVTGTGLLPDGRGSRNRVENKRSHLKEKDIGEHW
jgi:hypothetical protein